MNMLIVLNGYHMLTLLGIVLNGCRISKGHIDGHKAVWTDLDWSWLIYIDVR